MEQRLAVCELKNFGWAPKGIPPVQIQPASTGQNLSYLVSLTIRGVFFHINYTIDLPRKQIWSLL
ncbi:hypothetical protein HZS_3898 [Henneguya salminicola]|nr:hypothetical protein HZS_3898 [Henneguya salminicola]